MSITQKAIEHGLKLLGMPYSQTYRYKFYPTGSADCSSFTYACFSAAGFPLLQNGEEKMTSCYEVYADGFNLLFPEKESDIGKSGKWAPKGFYKTFDWKTGDIIFYNFDKSSTRDNMITHVAMCFDKNYILHTANTREKVCKKAMSYGDGKILAVIRIKDDNAPLARPVITKDNAPKIFVRMMQILLNVGGGNPQLNCDGVWGSKTLAALNQFKAMHGQKQNGVCGEATWALLLDLSVNPSLSETWAVSRELKRTNPLMSGDDVLAFKKALVNAGYLYAAIKNTFGDDTDKAVRTFQKAKGLTVDGIAGKDTITALGGDWNGAENTTPASTLTIGRLLKRTSPLMEGDDVYDMKQALLKLGYLSAATKKTFGDDTDKAVRAFQKDKKLNVDGIVGEKTTIALGGKWTGK